MTTYTKAEFDNCPEGEWTKKLQEKGLTEKAANLISRAIRAAWEFQADKGGAADALRLVHEAGRELAKFERAQPKGKSYPEYHALFVELYECCTSLRFYL